MIHPIFTSFPNFEFYLPFTLICKCQCYVAALNFVKSGAEYGGKYVRNETQLPFSVSIFFASTQPSELCFLTSFPVAKTVHLCK